MTQRKNPLISVIIPAYNEELYIRSCLTALVNQQTNEPYEIIVVDNNSLDQTYNIAKSYGVRILRETKKGASAARNAGVRQAHGDIMVFVDADCIVPPNHLEKIADQFEVHHSLSVLAGPYIHHDGGLFIRWATDDLDYYTKLFTMYKIVFGVQGFASGNVAIKKSVYIKQGGFNESLDDVIKAEDLELAIRLYKAGIPVTYLPSLKVMASYRRINRAPLATTFMRSYYVINQLIHIPLSLHA